MRDPCSNGWVKHKEPAHDYLIPTLRYDNLPLGTSTVARSPAFIDLGRDGGWVIEQRLDWAK